jgi:acyl-CoA reductase-like NAD-dependent aldehyde dehydrogenase
MVNLLTAGVDYHVPFGGTKGSSYGSREQGSYAAEFYTKVRTAYILPLTRKRYESCAFRRRSIVELER